MVTQLALAFLLKEINFFKTTINISANERSGLAKVGSNLKASETKILSRGKLRYCKIMWLVYKKGRKSWNIIGEIIRSQQTEIAYKMLNLIKCVNGGWWEKLIQAKINSIFNSTENWGICLWESHHFTSYFSSDRTLLMHGTTCV